MGRYDGSVVCNGIKIGTKVYRKPEKREFDRKHECTIKHIDKNDATI